MASGSRGRGDRGRNRRFLENLQQSMGAGPGLRKPQRQKIQASSEDLPKDFEDFLRILQMEKKNVSLSELGDYYKENYGGYEDDQVADIAEILFKIGFEGSAIYDFVGFLNIGFADERLQQKMANEFIVHAAGLFDLEEPELSKYEDFGRFIGLLLKAKFNRPYHQISDSSNRFLVAVMSVFLGFLSEVPVLLESGDEVDLKNAKWKTTAVIAAVKALNRRLFMDYYDLNDDIYKFLRSILIDTDGKEIGKDFRKSLLDVLIEMEKYSVAGAPPSKTEKERDAFIMKCTIHQNGSWKTEVVACLAPNGIKIPINSSIDDGSDQWKCSMNDRGMVTLVQGPNPNAKCDGHEVGSRWQEKSFELECLPGGVRKLKACVTEDGQKIPVNGSKEVNGFTLICQSFSNGTVSFHGQKSVNAPKVFGGNPTSAHCTDEQNGERRVGEHWIENHRFNKTCRANGAVEVVNCISKDSVQVPLNRQIVKDGSKYTCEMTPQGTIRFSAAPVNDHRVKFRKYFI